MIRITNNLFESIQKVTSGEVAEASVDKAHFCATHVEHSLLGYGECISEQHAEPDENGNIAWYTVNFPTGTHKVNTSQLRVVEGKSHMHSRKMAEDTEVIEEAEGGTPKTDAHKKLAAHYGDPNKITRGDVITAAKKNAMKKEDVTENDDIEQLDEIGDTKAGRTALNSFIKKAKTDTKDRSHAIGYAKAAMDREGPSIYSGRPKPKRVLESEDDKKDTSAFDWKSKAKNSESSFEKKKTNTGTVYTRKPSKEKEDMKEGVSQTVINHQDFVLEITDNPTFADYFNAMQAIVPSMDENIQKEMITIATEAYNEGYVDVILESMAREAFSTTLNNYRKEGYSVLDEHYIVESSEPYVEYTLEKDGTMTKYVHVGAVVNNK